MLLGVGPSCYWTGTRTLTVLLGSNFTLVPRTFLELAPGVVFESGGISASRYIEQVYVLPPDNIVYPVIRIDGSTKFSFCETVVLSTTSSGNLGKPFTVYNWTFVGMSSPPAGLEEILASSTEQVSIPAINAGRYTVRLEVENWMGARGATEFSFSMSNNVEPAISSTSPLIQEIARKNYLQIATKSELPSCGNGANSLDATFVRNSKWTQIFPGTSKFELARAAAGAARSALFRNLTSHPVTLEGADSLTLVVERETMNMGETYGFQIEVTNVINGSTVGSASETFIVIIKKEPILAAISGGSEILVPVLSSERTLSNTTSSRPQSFILDASFSQDPANATSPLTYHWKFRLVKSTTAARSALLMYHSVHLQKLLDVLNFTTTSPQLSLNLSKLYPDAVYLINLKVSSGREGADSEIEQVLQTTSDPVPIVEVSGGGTVNEGDDVTLIMSVQGGQLPQFNYLYHWECTSGNLNLTDPATRATQLNSEYLALLGSSLIRDAVYKFRAYVSEDGIIGTALTSVSVNAAPALGSCSGFPEVGVGLQTIFALSCTGWSDLDTPLIYYFSSITSGSTLTLSNPSQKSSVTTLIAGQSTPTTIIATIRDSLLASTTSNFTLNISVPLTLSVSDTTSVIETRISEGDSGLAAILISGTASFIFSNNSKLNASEQASAVSSLVATTGSLVNNSVQSTSAQVNAPLAVLQVVTSGPSTSLNSAAQTSVLNLLDTITTNPLNTFSTTSTTSTLSVLGGVLQGSNIQGSTTTSGSAPSGATGDRITGVLQNIAQGVLASSVPGAAPKTMSSRGMTLTVQSRLSSNILGSVTKSTSGANVKISPSLPLVSDNAVGVMLSTVNGLYPTRSTDTTTVTVDVFQDKKNLAASNLAKPFKIAIPAQILSEEYEYVCRFWNSSINNYSTNGLSVGSSPNVGELACESTHLTSFSGEASFRVQVNTFGKDDINEKAFSYENPVMVLVSSMLIIYTVCAIVFSRCYHPSLKLEEDKKAMYKHTMEMECNFWRKLNRSSITIVAGTRSFSTFISMAYWKLRRGHVWLAILIRHPGDFLTSFKRLTILFTLLFNSTTISILLYGQNIELGFIKGTLAVSIFAMVLAYPIPFFATYFFRRSPPTGFRVPVDSSKDSVACLPLILAMLSDADIVEEDVEEEDPAGDEEGQSERQENGDGGEEDKGDNTNGPGGEENAAKSNGVSRQGYNADFVVPHQAALAAGTLPSDMGPAEKREKKSNGKDDILDASAPPSELPRIPKKVTSDSSVGGDKGCNICGYPSRDNPKTTNHDFTIQDLIATVGCIIAMMGCAFILAVLSVTLGLDSYDGVLTVLSSFAQDFGSRCVMICLIQYIFFGPLCLALFSWNASGANNLNNKRGHTSMVIFDSGILGFAFTDGRVSLVQEDSQSSGQIQVGWKIININGKELHEDTTDLEIHNLLQKTQKVYRSFFLIFGTKRQSIIQLELLEEADTHVKRELKLQNTRKHIYVSRKPSNISRKACFSRHHIKSPGSSATVDTMPRSTSGNTVFPTPSALEVPSKALRESQMGREVTPSVSMFEAKDPAPFSRDPSGNMLAAYGALLGPKNSALQTPHVPGRSFERIYSDESSIFNQVSPKHHNSKRDTNVKEAALIPGFSKPVEQSRPVLLIPGFSHLAPERTPVSSNCEPAQETTQRGLKQDIERSISATSGPTTVSATDRRTIFDDTEGEDVPVDLDLFEDLQNSPNADNSNSQSRHARMNLFV